MDGQKDRLMKGRKDQVYFYSPLYFPSDRWGTQMVNKFSRHLIALKAKTIIPPVEPAGGLDVTSLSMNGRGTIIDWELNAGEPGTHSNIFYSKYKDCHYEDNIILQWVSLYWYDVFILGCPSGQKPNGTIV